MNPSAASKETFFAPESPQAGEIYDFIKAHDRKKGHHPAPQFFLSCADTGDQVEIPLEIYEVLVKAVDAMRNGMAVTITPSSLTLTTQQAAEILGVTRPTVVRFLDAGKIPFEKPGTHRRIKLEDLAAFRAARREEQYAGLASLGEADDEESEVVLERLKKARAIAGQHRRNQSG